MKVLKSLILFAFFTRSLIFGQQFIYDEFNNEEIRAVDFLNADIGWRAVIYSTNQLKVLKTTNKGINWLEIRSGITVSNPSHPYISIDVVSENL